MKEESIVRAKRLPDGTLVQILPDGTTRPLQNRTDLARLEATTDEDIEQQITEDSDVAPLLDDNFWQNAKRITPTDRAQEIGVQVAPEDLQYIRQNRLDVASLLKNAIKEHRVHHTH